MLFKKISLLVNEVISLPLTWWKKTR